jgi:integrase
MKDTSAKLPDAIWMGWSHLDKARLDLEEPAIANAILDVSAFGSESRDVLAIINQTCPQLLIVSAEVVKLESAQTSGLLNEIGAGVDPERRFAILRRTLEVINAANRMGRFNIPIPWLPAPLPPQAPSPFIHQDFERLGSLSLVIEAYAKSLTSSDPLDNSAMWGRLLFSALLFGGLLRTDTLLGLENGLASSKDMQWRWVDIPIMQSTATINKCLIDDSSEKRGEMTLRRWFPDPLSRLLLRTADMPFPMPHHGRSRSGQVMYVLHAYAKLAGFDSLLCRFKNLRELQKTVKTRAHLFLPPYQVHYITGGFESASLPPHAWNRLVNPPTRIPFERPLRKSRSGIVEGADPESEEGDISDRGEELSSNEDAWVPQLRQLGSLVRNSGDAAKARIAAWRISQSDSLLPSVGVVAEWIETWLLSKRRGGRPLRPKTIYQMLNCGGTPLVALLGDRNPADLGDVDAYIELYEIVLEGTSTTGVRRRAANSLQSFHQFLSKRYKTPAIDSAGVFQVHGKSRSVADANLLSTDTFFRAMQWLHHEEPLRHKEDATGALTCIASLGFFAGLRRSEAIGLAVGDIRGIRNVTLTVAPNSLRALKTRNALRNIPLSEMLPPAELNKLLTWQRKRIANGAAGNDPMFPIFWNGNRIRDNDYRLELITEALQRSTNDASVRFHHLRHSFATWTLFKFWLAEQPDAGAILPDWFLPTEHDKKRWKIVAREREALLGDAPSNRRSLMQVSRLLGHNSVDITLGSYVHLLDFMTGVSVRRLAPDLNVETLAVLSGMSKTRVAELRREAIARNEDADDLSGRVIDAVAVRALAKGQHIKPSRIAGVVHIPEKPQLDLPTDSFEKWFFKIQTFASLLADGSISSEIAERIQVTEEDVGLMKLQWHRMPPGIARRMSSPQDQCIDIPRTGSPLNAVRYVYSTVSSLIAVGDRPAMGAAGARKKLSELVQSFPKHWQSHSLLTLKTDTVSDAKRWIWILSKAGLIDAILVTHVPSIGQAVPAASRQVFHWEHALGVMVVRHPDDKERVRTGTRGRVTISVDGSKLGSAGLAFNSADLQWALRFLIALITVAPIQ